MVKGQPGLPLRNQHFIKKRRNNIFNVGILEDTAVSPQGAAPEGRPNIQGVQRLVFTGIALLTGGDNTPDAALFDVISENGQRGVAFQKLVQRDGWIDAGGGHIQCKQR